MNDVVYFVRIWFDKFPDPKRVYGRIKEENDDVIIIETGSGKLYTLNKEKSKYEIVPTNFKFEVRK